MMEAGGYQPSGTVWGSLITACGKAGQLGCAEALWAEMQAAGEPRTAELYHSLMNACVWTYQVRGYPGIGLGEGLESGLTSAHVVALHVPVLEYSCVVRTGLIVSRDCFEAQEVTPLGRTRGTSKRGEVGGGVGWLVQQAREMTLLA